MLESKCSDPPSKNPASIGNPEEGRHKNGYINNNLDETPIFFYLLTDHQEPK